MRESYEKFGGRADLHRVTPTSKVFHVACDERVCPLADGDFQEGKVGDVWQHHSEWRRDGRGSPFFNEIEECMNIGGKKFERRPWEHLPILADDPVVVEYRDRTSQHRVNHAAWRTMRIEEAGY